MYTVNGKSVTFGKVSFDAGEEEIVFDAYYDPSERWNGFLAAPLLTLESALRLMAYNDAERVTHPDACARFTYDAEALCFTETDDTWSDTEVETQHICADWLDSDTAHDTPLFAIGAYGWTWLEVN